MKPIQPRSLLALHLALLLLLSYLFLFHGLGAYSLKEPDEGRYAEIPREMVESGNYIVPYLNYARYFEKPPLLYWSVALSYKIFGVNEWAFRFPNALFAFFSVLTVYLLGRRWFGAVPAFLASTVLVSSLGFFSMARIVTTDMMLSFWLFLALGSFYGYYREKRDVFIYLFYISLSFATLTKGPISLVLTAISIFLFLFTERRLSFISELRWKVGVPLFLLITAPWFVAVSLMEKDFFYFFFIDQHLLRFLTSKHKRSGPVYYFVPVLLGGFVPWSLLLPGGIARFWKRPDLRLFFLWSLVVFLFFSFSGSKLPPYILPIFPALALIIGNFLHEKWQHNTHQAERIGYVCLFSLFFLAACLYTTGLLDGYLATVSPQGRSTVFGARSFAWVVCLLSVTAALSLVLRKPLHSSVFYTLAAFSALLMVGLLMNMGVIDNFNTTKRLATIIKALAAPSDVVVDYSSFNESLPFYTGRRVYLASYKGELRMGSEYPDAKAYFLTDAEFINLFRSEKRVFCVVKTKRLGHLKRLGISGRELGQEGQKTLISNY